MSNKHLTKSKKKGKEEEEKRLVIYGTYTNIIQSIKHFERLQTHYRIISSTMLLATFAAIGFILSSQVKLLPIDISIAIFFIGLLSLTALTSLWYLDLFLKERLLISHFVEAIKLEKKTDWLPKVHINILKNQNHKEAPSKKIVFYLGSGTTLILIMGISSLFFIGNRFFLEPFIISLLTLFSIIIYGSLLKKKTGNFKALVRSLEER